MDVEETKTESAAANFVGELRRQEKLYSETRLCVRCRSIQLHHIPDGSTGLVFYNSYNHISNAQDIFNNAEQGCPLCKIFISDLVTHIYFGNIPTVADTIGPQDLPSLPILLNTLKSQDGIGIEGLLVWLPINKILLYESGLQYGVTRLKLSAAPGMSL